MAITAAGQAPTRLSVADQFFVHFNSRWERPPPQAHLLSRTAEATIVLFKSSGEFVEHSCVLIEEPDKSWHISNGDGHVVAVGTWSLEGSHIVVHRNSIDRMVWPVGGGLDPLCGSKDVAFEVAGERLVHGKNSFVRTQKIDTNNFEAYAAKARGSHARCGA
jgi:hypothetical protein